MRQLVSFSIKDILKKLLPLIAVFVIAFIFHAYSVNKDKIQGLGKIQAKAVEETTEFVQETVVPEGYIGIYTAEDFFAIKNNNPDNANTISGNYILMADIDMSGKEYQIIGENNSGSGSQAPFARKF